MTAPTWSMYIIELLKSTSFLIISHFEYSIDITNTQTKYKMDGDASAKTMDKGASAYVKPCILASKSQSANIPQCPEKRRHGHQRSPRGRSPQRRARRREDHWHRYLSIQRRWQHWQTIQGYVNRSRDHQRQALTSTIADGAIGQIGEKVGGPFSSQGSIGKQFTTEGSIGGTVQQNLGQGENNTFQK